MRSGRGHIGFALVALAAAANATPAIAHPPAPSTVHGRPITGTVHRWLHQAKVPPVHGRVQLAFQPCPRYRWLAGCIWSKRPRRIYIRRGLADERRILYHELGHIFDSTVLNRAERRKFKRIMHIRRHGWYGGARPPAEWFADAYSICALRHRLAAATPYGYRPTRPQHRAVCRLISRAAAAGGAAPQHPRNPPPVVEPRSPPPSRPAQPPPSCGAFGELLGCPHADLVAGIPATNPG